jgi:hypothetical protein
VTSDHFFYIPMILLVGTILGFVLGRKAGINHVLLEQEQEVRRAERRARRQENKEQDSGSA